MEPQLPRAARPPAAPAPAPAAKPLTPEERGRRVGDPETSGPEERTTFHLFTGDGALLAQPGGSRARRAAWFSTETIPPT